MRRILIENDGIELTHCSFGLPWEYDATCFNFHAPDEVLQVSEIDKIDFMNEVESLIIGCDLEDYSFIADMVNLRQLYIYAGKNIYDLSFVKTLSKLSHLHIGDSHIESLEDLKELISEQKRLHDEESDLRKRLMMTIDAICISSDKELDGRELLEPGVYVSEIIINCKKIEE